MIKTIALGVNTPSDQFKVMEIERRLPGPEEVLIKIQYCGICHSDIHTARGEWGGTKYPCVPGHEIVGHIIELGKKVKKFKLNDPVGVGCFVDSCGECSPCKSNEEQFCQKGATFTYNSIDKKTHLHTLGGYSQFITVHQDYVLKLKKNVDLAPVAPLLCAGITTYSPLKKYGVSKKSKVGVVGLGGLGHMAVKIAKAMGAEVTVFSTSPNKKKDALKLGAKNFVLTTDKKAASGLNLDLIIDTVSADHELNYYLNHLKIDGTHVLLGVPPQPYSLHAGLFISGRKKLTGSLIGGIKETQEMLDFCFKKKVFSEVEVIAPNEIDQAYERTIKGQVKYRFVIDNEQI